MNFFLKRRTELGLSQREVSRILDMSDVAVGSWERGTSIPRLTLAPKLAEVYGVSRDRIESEIVKLTRVITANASELGDARSGGARRGMEGQGKARAGHPASK